MTNATHILINAENKNTKEIIKFIKHFCHRLFVPLITKQTYTSVQLSRCF